MTAEYIWHSLQGDKLDKSEICSTLRKRSFPHSWLINGILARVTRRVHLVEQEVHTLPEHLSSFQVFSGVHVTRSLVYVYVL